MIAELEAYMQAQEKSNAAWAQYRAADDEAARALEAYTKAVFAGTGRALVLDVERPLNPGDETAINNARAG